MTDTEIASEAHVLVKNVTVRYQSRHGVLEALQKLSMEVLNGEFVSIVGASGCGKTTLLRAIGGLLTPDEGSVSLRGEPPRSAQRRKSIGIVFQDPSLLPWLNVEENIRIAFDINGARRGHDESRLLVDLVGLGDFRHYHPRHLSGGMKQRVALARALALDPEFLLLDEPLAALDEITRCAMRYEILRLWGHTNATAVLVTHSIPEAVAMSDRVLVMDGPPGGISSAVSVDLPRPRDASIERTQPFQDLVDRIHGLLRHGAPS